jgi:hypothetical protein
VIALHSSFNKLGMEIARNNMEQINKSSLQLLSKLRATLHSSQTLGKLMQL